MEPTLKKWSDVRNRVDSGACVTKSGKSEGGANCTAALLLPLIALMYAPHQYARPESARGGMCMDKATPAPAMDHDYRYKGVAGA